MMVFTPTGGNMVRGTSSKWARYTPALAGKKSIGRKQWEGGKRKR